MLASVAFRAHDKRYLTSLHGTRSQQITSTHEAHPRISRRTPAKSAPSDCVPATDQCRFPAEILTRRLLTITAPCHPVVQRVEGALEEPLQGSSAKCSPPADGPAPTGSDAWTYAIKATTKLPRTLPTKTRPTVRGTEPTPMLNSALWRAQGPLLPPGVRIEIGRYRGPGNRLSSGMPTPDCLS